MSSERESPQTTSWHAARAVGGNEHSLSWLIGRLTPLLLAQARLRMGRALSRRVDPEDVVQEAWGLALSRIHQVRPRDDRWAGPLLAYIGSILRHRILEHARQLARRASASSGDRDGLETPVAEIPMEITGQITRIAREERRDIVLEAIENLSPTDRQIIVYRGIEQLSQVETGQLVGIEPNTVGVRYHRALKRLRERLPNTVFDDLED